jgi:hypothetical protein
MVTTSPGFRVSWVKPIALIPRIGAPVSIAQCSTFPSSPVMSQVIDEWGFASSKLVIVAFADRTFVMSYAEYPWWAIAGADTDTIVKPSRHAKRANRLALA